MSRRAALTSLAQVHVVLLVLDAERALASDRVRGGRAEEGTGGREGAVGGSGVSNVRKRSGRESFVALVTRWPATCF